jgi:protein phosphatase
VADSRASLVRRGEPPQPTKHQPLTQRLVDAGEMTEEEAEQSTRRNIILQALGPDPRVKVDLTFLPLCRDDVILICSDGLSGQVKREEMGNLATAQADPQAVCEALIEMANSRGGPDNITVVVVRLDGAGLPQADAEVAAEYQPTPILEEDTDEMPVPSTPIRTTQPIPILQRPARPEAKAPPPAPVAARRSGVTPARFEVIGLGVLGVLALLFWLIPRLMT